MARVERICPAFGLTPIPAIDLLDVGNIHDVVTFDAHFSPTQWIYDRNTEETHERCAQRRVDFPLEVERQPDLPKEIPQVTYHVTHMTFQSANWESKAKKMARKGGSFAKSVVVPYTGNPDYGEIPEAWKPIMGSLTSASSSAHIPYGVRMGLVTCCCRHFPYGGQLGCYTQRKG